MRLYQGDVLGRSVEETSKQFIAEALYLDLEDLKQSKSNGKKIFLKWRDRIILAVWSYASGGCLRTASVVAAESNVGVTASTALRTTECSGWLVSVSYTHLTLPTNHRV